jgi:hypothetical protein
MRSHYKRNSVLPSLNGKKSDSLHLGRKKSELGKLMKVIYEVAYVVVDHVVLGIILIDNHAYIAIIII